MALTPIPAPLPPPQTHNTHTRTHPHPPLPPLLAPPPPWPPHTRGFWCARVQVSIQGTCKPGYEGVRSLFRQQLESGAHMGAQCCAFVRGECVVDLAGSIKHDYRGAAVTYGRLGLLAEPRALVFADRWLRLASRATPTPTHCATGASPDLPLHEHALRLHVRVVRSPGLRSVQNIYSSTKTMTSLVVSMLADRGHLDLEQLVCDIWPEFGQRDLRICDVMRQVDGMRLLRSGLPPHSTVSALCARAVATEPLSACAISAGATYA